MPTDNARSTGPALERMQQFLVWLVPTIEKFPRSQKFTLGDRIQNTALDVLERIIEATYTRARAKSLNAANLTRTVQFSANPPNNLLLNQPSRPQRAPSSRRGAKERHGSN